MQRRGFLQSLLGLGAAAATLDIEKLPWVPGAKTIFIPPAPPTIYGVMFYNREVTVAEICRWFNVPVPLVGDLYRVVPIDARPGPIREVFDLFKKENASTARYAHGRSPQTLNQTLQIG